MSFYYFFGVHHSTASLRLRSAICSAVYIIRIGLPLLNSLLAHPYVQEWQTETMAPSPIVTPGKIVVFAPIITSFPI